MVFIIENIENKGPIRRKTLCTTKVLYSEGEVWLHSNQSLSKSGWSTTHLLGNRVRDSTAQ